MKYALLPLPIRFWPILVGLVMSVLLLACQNTTPAPGPAPASPVAPIQPARSESPLAAPISPLARPVDFQIEPGRAAVRGRLLSTVTGQPLVNITMRLAEIYCPEEVTTQQEKEEKCFWALDDAMSPSAQTDANGDFVLRNVEARDYAMMVGSIMTRYEMVENAEEKPIIYTPKADEVLEVGDLTVPFQ